MNYPRCCPIYTNGRTLSWLSLHNHHTADLIHSSIGTWLYAVILCTDWECCVCSTSWALYCVVAALSDLYHWTYEWLYNVGGSLPSARFHRLIHLRFCKLAPFRDHFRFAKEQPERVQIGTWFLFCVCRVNFSVFHSFWSSQWTGQKTHLHTKIAYHEIWWSLSENVFIPIQTEARQAFANCMFADLISETHSGGKPLYGEFKSIRFRCSRMGLPVDPVEVPRVAPAGSAQQLHR